MSSPNSTIIRQWLLTQRTALAQRLVVLDQLIAELNGPPPAPAPVEAATPATTPRSIKKLLPSHARTLETLRQAGPEGLSASDLATLDSVPIGTASSRLSIIKSAGLAGLNGHRYFVLHSESQDNNSEPRL